jgi:type IX secretion system PorP/SprF family membrane protein
MKISLLKTLFCLLIVTVSFSVQAQQDPTFSQYLMNPLAYNPAYAGSYDMVNATATSRLQKSGTDKPVLTNAFALHSSFPSTDVMGLGIYVMTRKFDIYKFTDVTMAYSYKIKINDYTRLSFGLQSTYSSHGYDYGNLTMSDQQLRQGDPLYNLNNTSISKLNFGGGLFLLNQEKFFASLSVPKILASKFERNGIAAESYNPVIYVSGGVILGGKSNLPVRPAFLLRTSKGVATSIDLSTSVLLSKIIWAGVSLRDLKTLAVIGQLDITEHLRVGYSMDIQLHDSPVNTFGTHEFSVNLNLAAFKKQTVIPRFF